jgi:hypothetical protein
MDIETTEGREQQIESFTTSTQVELWNDTQKEVIIATLSKKYPNRVHTEALEILKLMSSDERNTLLFRNMVRFHILIF